MKKSIFERPKFNSARYKYLLRNFGRLNKAEREEFYELEIIKNLEKQPEKIYV